VSHEDELRRQRELIERLKAAQPRDDAVARDEARKEQILRFFASRE
jgi:hypothetical protein